MPTEQKLKNLGYWIAVIAVLLMIGAHSYLASVHYSLAYGQSEGQSICNINAQFDCEAVSASRYSEFLGTPMALWGLFANTAFLIFLALARVAKGEGRAVQVLIAATSTLVVGASIIMAVISALFLNKYCLICISTYILSIASLVGVFLFLRPQLRLITREAGRYTGILLFCGLGVGVLTKITDYAIRNSMGEQDISPIVQASISDWKAAADLKPQAVSPLIMGASAADAKLTLVEFADYRCIHCKHAAPVLHAFVSARPDVRLLFQPWPLDGACNPKIPQANHASCLLAQASYCASKLAPMEKAWGLHKFLYDNQERWVTQDSCRAALPEMASAIGVDSKVFADCAESEEAQNVARAQSKVGDDLDLQGTPTLYANGKILSGANNLAILKAAYNSL